ncbi:MAG: hypothetical protein U0835_08390 [Isosphaeraceae bacterium]
MAAKTPGPDATKSPSPALPETPPAPVGTSMQKYLDRAVKVLGQFGGADKQDTNAELIRLLEEVKHLDEPRVLAISRTISYMSRFNQLVRDNVENIDVGNRYLQIAQQFDSIREDSKTLINQLQDGRISASEKMQNLWMRLRRGTPSARFEEIAKVYKSVASSTKDQLDREQKIMDAYIDFRFALKEAEVMSRELFEAQNEPLEAARKGLTEAQEKVQASAGGESEKSRLELARDEAAHKFEVEDRNYQLLKDVAENLSVGYDVGETLITKLKQTHDVKDRVYRRSVTFFTTNEHVFTILGTVYTSQYGLHEATQAQEAMKEGVNRGLEDVAELGRELERAAIKAGYGSTISASSVEKLVQAISDYQVESLNMIAELRKESEESSKAIRRVVEDGKKKYQETLAKFALEGSSNG